jgi:signal transduction histidine kinase/ligand-binding sensor domain-containing protein
MVWRSLIFLTVVITALVPAPAAEWVTRAWQMEDGLPQDTVNAIVQTHDGFLWVGTNAGLVRFDGVRFRKFGLQDGLRSVYVTALAEDRAGALWVGTSGGGVSCWDRGRFTSFEVEAGFPAGLEVIALAADRDGSVWIGTDKGLVHWKRGTFKIVSEAEGLPRKQVRALLQDAQGTLWVSVILEGLFRGTNGRFARVEGSDPTPNGVYVFCEDRDGSIWAASDSLWKCSGDKWRHFDPSNGLPKAPIQSLARSSDGTFWVGVRGHGLFCSTGEQFVQPVSEGPLATQSVGALTTDREGSVWAGAVFGGLHRLSPRVLQFWDENSGLPPTTVTSVVEEASGALCVGTASQGLQRFENGRFTPLADPVAPGLPIIYCTTGTSDGAVWAAGEQCLFRFQPGQPTQAFRDPPVRGEAIRALCPDGETLWLGSYASALLRCDHAGVQVVAPAGSFLGAITSIVREAPGTLWIGTSAGLYRWEQGKVETWTTRDGLLTAYIRALHRDPDGTLWIGTLGGGLTRMKDGRFVNITTRQGLVDDVISQIVADDFGGLWLGCNRGLMRLERRELDAFADGKTSEVQPVVLGRNEGMLKEQFFGGTSPNAIKTRDGHLFFPTANGLVEIDPRRLKDLTLTAPRAIIEEIRVDQRPQPLDFALIIPPGKHQIDIAYTAPALRGGQWLRFRYLLDGFDPAWLSAGGLRLASYDGLPPGRYVFRVAAADCMGEWNESGASLALTVQPFFWQTLWPRIGGVLLLVAAGSTAAWGYAHSKHLRQLAAFEIERSQQAELARVSRVSLLGELSASLAHELNQPLAAILGNARAAQRFLADDPADMNEVRACLEDIAESDRRASEIIRRMRSMMKKGEAQIEPRDINADIEQVLGLLHSEFTSRQVTVATHLLSGLPPVWGDHIQLQQVLLNLVINGCDAMHDTPPAERRLLITSQLAADKMVRVSVRDHGVGVPPKLLEQIFTAFFSTKKSGLGMGLSICRAIIEAHRGLLWPENNADRGATFHFTLRLGERKQA